MIMRKDQYVVWISVLISTGGFAADLRDEISGSGGGGTLDRPVSFLNGAQVLAEKSASNVSVKVSRTSSFTMPAKSVGTEVGTGVFSAWSLTASAPLNKSSQDSDVTSLDGLVNAASLELKYSRFLVNGRKRPDKEALANLDAICRRVFEAMKLQTGESPQPGRGCDSGEVAKYSPNDLLAFDNAFWDFKDLDRWIWGGSAKIGYQNFDFIDASSGAKDKQDETPWSVGAFFSYNPDSWKALLTVSFQYQHAFKE